MTLLELKKAIKNQELDDNLIIFVADDYFLPKQYLEAICQLKCSKENRISSIYEPINSTMSLIFNFESYINTLYVDTFEEQASNYSIFKNTIVFCHKIDKAIIEKTASYTVKIDSPQDWQVKDYISIYCPGLDPKLIDYFYACTKGNMYKIENELDKIKLFDVDKRNSALTALLREENTDLIKEVSTFDFCEYLAEGNIEAVRRSLYVRDYCDFQATFLVSILIQKFRAIAGCLETNLSADDLGLSIGQYKYLKYIKYKQGKKPNSKFIEKSLKFLTEIDYKLKTGKLDIDEKQKQDLIICRILSFYLNK